MAEQKKEAQVKSEWKHDNDIMQNMVSHFIGPLKQLREALVEERNKLIDRRNDLKKKNING